MRMTHSASIRLALSLSRLPLSLSKASQKPFETTSGSSPGSIARSRSRTSTGILSTSETGQKTFETTCTSTSPSIRTSSGLSATKTNKQRTKSASISSASVLAASEAG
jgi:hypothetical protein